MTASKKWETSYSSLCRRISWQAGCLLVNHRNKNRIVQNVIIKLYFSFFISNWKVLTQVLTVFIRPTLGVWKEAQLIYFLWWDQRYFKIKLKWLHISGIIKELGHKSLSDSNCDAVYRHCCFASNLITGDVISQLFDNLLFYILHSFTSIQSWCLFTSKS